MGLFPSKGAFLLLTSTLGLATAHYRRNLSYSAASIQPLITWDCVPVSTSSRNKFLFARAASPSTGCSHAGAHLGCVRVREGCFSLVTFHVLEKFVPLNGVFALKIPLKLNWLTYIALPCFKELIPLYHHILDAPLKCSCSLGYIISLVVNLWLCEASFRYLLFEPLKVEQRNLTLTTIIKKYEVRQDKLDWYQNLN